MAAERSTADSPLTLLQSLSALDPQPSAVISVYLDLRAGDRGRDTHDVFLRSAFGGSLKADAQGASDASGMGAAFERIRTFLEGVDRSAKAAAVFTSAGDGAFLEGLALDATVESHQLFVGPVPHLYPLARLIDQFPRYAAVLLDSHRARIVVFGLDAGATRAEVQSEKTRRHSMGGWSQARYQRRTENVHLHHLKEVVETLERVVRDEDIEHVIVAGDTAIVARLREQLPKALAEKVVDELRLDRHAGEDAVLEEALAAFRRKDAERDAERVDEVLGAWRAGGLGVVGPEATLRALQQGQVDELLIVAKPAALKPVQGKADDTPTVTLVEASADDGAGHAQVQIADQLVTRAAQTGATVRMIEDPELLRMHGGVAAALRFRL